MSGLENRISRAENAVGISASRKVWIVLHHDHTEADIAAAYANASLEQRETDELTLICTGIAPSLALRSPPYPCAQVIGG